MPWVQPEAEIERLIQPRIDQRWDGTIIELYEDYAHVRLTGSRQIKRDCKIADYIDRAELRTGQRVRLLADDHGHPFISAYFQPCGKRGGLAAPDEDCDTPSRPGEVKVTYLPDLIGNGDEWSITWKHDPENADYYILFAATSTSGAGKVEIGSFDSGYASVPVNHLPSSSYRYFGIQAVQGETCKSAITWRSGTNETTPIVIGPPGGGGPIGPDYITQSKLYAWHDDGSTRFISPELSDWTLRNGSLAGSDINDMQGGLDPWWKVKQASENLSKIILLKGNIGKIYKTEDGGDVWIDKTPTTDPPNTFSDTPAPTAADLTYICRADNIHQSGRHYWLANWFNEKGEPRGWLLTTDDDLETFTWSNLSTTGIGDPSYWIYPAAVWTECVHRTSSSKQWVVYNDGNMIYPEGITTQVVKEEGTSCPTSSFTFYFIADFGVGGIDHPHLFSRVKGDMANRFPGVRLSNDTDAWMDPQHASWHKPPTITDQWYTLSPRLTWVDTGSTPTGYNYRYVRYSVDPELADDDGVSMEVDCFRGKNDDLVGSNPTMIIPIWMDVDSEDGTRLYITTWDDLNGIVLQVRDASTLSLSGVTVLDASATEDSIYDGSRIAYPMTPHPNGDKVFVFGRMNNPGGLSGIHHIIETEDGGSTWTNVKNDWGSDVCGALQAWHNGFSWEIACFRNLDADTYAEFWRGTGGPDYVSDCPFKVSVDALSILPSQGKIAIGALENPGDGKMVAESIDDGVTWNDITYSHPVSGQVRSVLYVDDAAGEFGVSQATKHLFDGGHPNNPYPTTPNSDDAEFHTTVPADNNSFGLISAGHFWEWVAFQPSLNSGAEDINITRRSHLYVQPHRLAGGDAILRGNITLPILPATLVTFTICVRWLAPVATTTDERVEIRVLDSASGNYFAVCYENDGTGPNMQLAQYYVDGGARTLSGSVLSFPTSPEAVWLQWRQQTTTTYRCSYTLDGKGAITNINTTAYTFLGAYVPDTLQLIFCKSDNVARGLVPYYIDSFRRE